MSGHSKWANIKHKKGKADAERGKIFTKIGREIAIAVKEGGSDPSVNGKLRDIIAKAKSNNMPNDNITRSIKKAAGEMDHVVYEEISYEGYAPGGVAVIVDCLTDNRVRTVADVRHAMSKHGGNMGTDGCVAFQFKHCGQMIFAPGTDEGALMDAAIEAGADDVNTNDDASIEVITAPTEFIAVKDALEAAGFKPEFAEVTMKPEGENVFAGDDGLKMQKLLDALESLDDVQEIYTTAVIED